jgi:hypothetical protein
MFAPAVGQSTLPFCLTYIRLPHVTLTRLSVKFLIGGHLELLAHVSLKREARGQERDYQYEGARQ